MKNKKQKMILLNSCWTNPYISFTSKKIYYFLAYGYQTCFSFILKKENKIRTIKHI